jgi:hypothetical protein
LLNAVAALLKLATEAVKARCALAIASRSLRRAVSFITSTVIRLLTVSFLSPRCSQFEIRVTAFLFYGLDLLQGFFSSILIGLPLGIVFCS